MTAEFLKLLVFGPIAIFLMTALIIRIRLFVGFAAHPRGACLYACLTLFVLSWFHFILPIPLESAPALWISALGSWILYSFCIGFLNWFCFELTENSMHFHLLAELTSHGGLSADVLAKLYNKDVIINARIPRLLEIGQLEIIDGHYRTVGRSILWAATFCIYLRKLLTIPPEPESES